MRISCHEITQICVVHMNVNAPSDIALEAATSPEYVHRYRVALSSSGSIDIARVIARVVRDPARAERTLAVEAFVRLWRTPRAHTPQGPETWLYRTAVRLGLDELRRQTQPRPLSKACSRSFAAFPRPNNFTPPPKSRERASVPSSRLFPRGEGRIASASQSRPQLHRTRRCARYSSASLGTLLARAQKIAFRKEYIRRHGQQ